MRNFNPEERELLEFIVSRHKEASSSGGVVRPIYVYDVFANKVSRIESFIQINLNDYYVEVRFSELQYKQVNTIQYRIENDFATVISLLDYLKKNNLINLIPIDGDIRGRLSISNNVGLAGSPNKIQIFKGEYRKYRYIYKDINDAIFPTAELIEYVVNSFKDEEQIRHEQNLHIQNTALEQAKKSTKAAIRLGNISIIIASLSLIAAIMALVPESRRQKIFGIKDKQELPRQQIYIIHNGAIPDSIKKMIDKNPVLKIKPSVKSDTVKK